MKTIEQLIEEIKTSDALKKDLAEALAKKDKAALEAFLKDNGCDVSIEEAKQFLQEKSAEMQKNGELSEAELEQVAGGTDVVMTVVTTILATGGITISGMLGAAYSYSC